MKRGQLQALEPVIVVVVLGLIIGIGLLFFVRVSESTGSAQGTVVDERQAIALMKRLTTLPELSCSRSETVETFCIDKYKAQEFAAMMQNPKKRTFYFPLLGSSHVNLTWIDLEASTTDLTLYDTLPPNASVRGSTTYFTVHDPVTDERMFAYITVRRESR